MELIKVATYVLLVIQGLATLSLAKTTPSDLGLKTSKEPSDTSALGPLYRKARQSRCIRCYDDRYADDGRQYSYSRNYYAGSYGSSGRSHYDDRNWYYYPFPDRYDSKTRYDDRYPERYDDRYLPRTYDRPDDHRGGYYDRYDSRGATPDFRGYGYDIPDKYYDRHNDGYYRDRNDRNRGGYEGRYYERDPYDRYPSRGGGSGGGYDYKNYRPWDETYRGTSGFDNSGRGYYFASGPHEQPTASHYRPPAPPSSSSYGGRPYLPNPPQSPPRPLQPLNPQNPQSSSSPTASSSSSSGSLPPSSQYPHHYQYNNRPPRPEDDSKGYAGGWSHVNDRNKPNDYSDRNKDTESPPYGPRPRPLGGSYLHDRDSNTPMAVKPISGDEKPEEAAKEPSATEQNGNTASSNSTN